MIRKLLPAAGAIAVLAFLLGPGQRILPSAIRLQSDGTLVTASAAPAHGESQGSGIGLAPAPVVNPAATAARLLASARPLEQAARGYALEARVTTPDGKPLVDASVRFHELVELFGQREMYIGTAQTDGRGAVAIAYLPARTGSHEIVVRSAGQGRVTAGEARVTFEATVAVPPIASEPRRLAAFSDRIPYVVGIVVLGVWGLIAFALFGTARGVVHGARDRARKEEYV